MSITIYRNGLQRVTTDDIGPQLTTALTLNNSLNKKLASLTLTRCGPL